MALAETSPPPDHRAEQQHRILNAAARCFARDGFHGTSMQKICTEAGMSPGALYRYFPSKESIIAAIVEGERAERARVFDTVAQAASLVDGLMACLVEMLDDEQGGAGKLGPEIMAEAARNPKLRDVIAPFEDETQQMLRAMLQGAQDAGEIDADIDLGDLQILFRAIGEGIVTHHQMHPNWQVPARLPAIGSLIKRMIAPAGKAS